MASKLQNTFCQLSVLTAVIFFFLQCGILLVYRAKYSDANRCNSFFPFSFDNEMILLVIKIQVERVQSLENTHFVKITYNLLETSE